MSFLKSASKFFIVMAMAAIGLNTDIVKLVKTGGKPIFMGFCCWVAIAGARSWFQPLLGSLVKHPAGARRSRNSCHSPSLQKSGIPWLKGCNLSYNPPAAFLPGMRRVAIIRASK